MNWVAEELTKSAWQMGKFEPAAVVNSEIMEWVFFAFQSMAAQRLRGQRERERERVRSPWG